MDAFIDMEVVMRKKLNACVLWSIVLLIAVFGGCEKKSPNAPDEPGGPTVEELILQAGELPDPETHPLNETRTEYEEQRNDGLWVCTKTIIDAAEASEKFPFFDPVAEIIWPGAALQGKTIVSPTPERIIARRGPGTIVINNITGATVSSVRIDEVTLSNVLDAANEIIRSQPQSFPANLYISIDSVRSNEELALKLKANANFFSLFKASSKFDVSRDVEVSSFLVSLTQSFYTLIFERPPQIGDFFHNEVSASELEPFIGENNPPVYVSSVTYGRVFYMLIEATEANEVVNASLNASFIVGGFEGNVKHVSQLNGLRVSAFALGGDANESLNAVLGGIRSLDKFISSLKAAGVITTGKPLSY